MNPMGKHITERNTTSENVTYLVDNKKCLCQHEKLYPLTDRRGKWISETMYRDIEKQFQQDSHKYTSSERIDCSSTQKLTNYEIEYYLFC